MDVNLMTKALFNVISDGENGCILDTLSVAVNAPRFDSGRGEFVQKLTWTVDCIASSPASDIMDALSREYDRLERGLQEGEQ